MTELLENTVGRLRQLLADDGAVPDGRLPSERKLADELDVSRRTLRQALAVLEIEGRVVRRQGSGTFVAAAGAAGPRGAPDAALLEAIERIGPLEVLEVRLSIEPTLARLAALRASAADIEQLGALAEATRVARTPRAYEQLDAAFHRRIALAARNALFFALFDSVLAAIDRGAWHGVRENAHCSKNKEVFSRFHKTLVEAIAGRAPDKAADAMFAHLCKVRDHLLAATYPQSIVARMDSA